MKWKTKVRVLFGIILVDVFLVLGLCLLVGSRVNEHSKIGVSTSVDVDKRYIALTFDDGPHPVYTPKLLEGLKERGVNATFFLVGKSIDGNEGIIEKMQKEGHLIGNHGYSHVQLNKEPLEDAYEQIFTTNEKIYKITGQMPTYIRPPFGAWSDQLEMDVQMTMVLWSVDPLDWKLQNTKQVVRNIMKKVKPGSIILLHDIFNTSVDAALEVIDTLMEQGYTFVTVDELLVD